VGHSLGGAPRVGDQQFSNFFDPKIPDLRRVNNDRDLVPTIPGRFLGFVHPQGSAVACADNPGNAQCQIAMVPNILEGNVIDHLGPYEGVFIGSPFCF